MDWMFAGFTAAVLAYFINGFAMRIWQDSALLGPIPLVEEAAKTILAFFFGAGILLTHLMFGIMEAVFDWQGENKRLSAAASAMVAHSVFGLVTVVAAQAAGMLGMGIVVAFFVHVLWNAIMLFRTVKR